MSAPRPDLRNALIVAAETAHRDYPQWAGHWDDWILARATRDLWRFGVTLLKRNTLVLVEPQPCTEHADCRVAYSVLRMLDVHTPPKYLTIEKETP